MLKGKRFYAKKPSVDWDVGHDYEIIRQIGSGFYSTVCEAKNIKTEESVAIKRISGIFDDAITCKRILREISILSSLNHPNIVKIKHIIIPRDLDSFNELYMVMEYAPSDLKKLLKSPINLQEDHIQMIVYNLLCGLKYLKSAEILHRNFKPSNILMYHNCEVKICDFKLARTLPKVKKLSVINGLDSKFCVSQSSSLNDESAQESELVRTMTTHVVTRWYRAPELILLEKNYGGHIDVWAIGCIVGEICGTLKGNTKCYLDRSPLLPGNSCFPLSPDSKPNSKGDFAIHFSDQLNVILNLVGNPTDEEAGFISDENSMKYLRSFPICQSTKLSKMYPHSNPAIIHLMENMLKFNPNERITPEEALSHPYFNNIRDSAKEADPGVQINLEFEDVEDIGCTELREYFITEIMKYN